MRKHLLVSDDLHPEPDIARALWTLQEARQRTLDALTGDLDPDADAGPGVNTVGTLLYHIAAIELDWLYAEVREEDYPEAAAVWFPQDVRTTAGQLTPVQGEALDRALERLAWVRTQLMDTFRTMTLHDYRRVRTLPPYDVTPEFVLAHLALHEAQHQGQILLLRRLNGQPAPRR
ncbi:DinB family protein [Deinococcus maricopensis]|uniref:DinB-like domain-containing protein n=1 Tax=Deinococcus maricopensis (strain DSM 21211 / LMG 22137 / NRRL B-23946 / LB-34) TaxID=709986 RepID=E8U4M9_DEIML|nr:DinB family protein [Deinococcus maricopensis]ADV68894.1 hypothetical protein Deima_3267 [Deinococcus maricopensis DSM 21211]